MRVAASQINREALAYLVAKRLRPGFNYQDVWAQSHAVAFTVAKAMRVDILQDIQDHLTQALAAGQSKEDFMQGLEPVLRQKGWWGRKDQLDPATGQWVSSELGSERRLKLIYDANIRQAHQAGAWQRAQRTKKTHPYLLYMLGPSAQHREQHVAWAGVILPVDDPWWDTHYPTNGYGCNCLTRLISKTEHRRLVDTGEYLTTAPPIEYTEFINKRSGEVVQVPVGIDPGWDTNPGKLRMAALNQTLVSKLQRSEDYLIQAAAREVMRSDLAQRWLAKPEGALPAGAVRRLKTGQVADSLVRLDADHLDLPEDPQQLAPILAKLPDWLAEQTSQVQVHAGWEVSLTAVAGRAPRNDPGADWLKSYWVVSALRRLD
jgi:hypothetical protein